MIRFLLSLLFVIGLTAATSAPVTVPITVTSDVITSVQLSGSAVQFGSSGPYYVGTLTTNLTPQTPTFNNLSGATYSLVSSAGGCSGGDTTHFQIIGDGVYTNTLAAGTYKLCVTASATGVASSTATFAGITEGNKIDAAAGVGTSGCTGSGTSGSPWNYLCIQNAVNTAVTGDTVFLRGGNWRLDTGDAAYVTINKAINLTGADSGNTFDAWGHVSNASGASLCPTSGTSITCVYETGTSFDFGTGAGQACFPGTSGACTPPAGFILNGSYTFGSSIPCASIANIFFDGSLTTDGGDTNGLLTFQYCTGGPITINNVRSLAYNEINIDNGEGQFSVLYSRNLTITNSLFADPASGIVGGTYPNSQVFQVTGGNSIGSNYVVQNNVFYQGAFNPIYLSNLAYTGNVQLNYGDGLGAPGIDPALGSAGAGMGGPANVYCVETGLVSGQCPGDLNLAYSNNLSYAPTHGFGLGGGVNDPTTSGGLNNMSLTGNWIISATGALDSCVWHIYNDQGNCAPGAPVGMTFNTAVDTSCNETYNSPNQFSITNNSILATTSAQLNGKGSVSTSATAPSDWITCKLGNPYTGSSTSIPTKVYGLNAQNNYLQSPSNQYLTNANTISPTQTNNYCSGSIGTWSGGSSCNTSGFSTPPTCSFTVGPLSGSTVPFTGTSFTAQYGSVQWLASTTATAPLSNDARWSGNQSFWTTFSATLPPSTANSFVPPVSLSGVSHGNTVYMWVMDSANQVASCGSAVIP